MHHPTDTQRTTKDLSPEALAQYHLQNRKEDRMLLQRAWHTAHRIASMLYEDFDATQVAVFGSLAEPEAFSNGRISISLSGEFRMTNISAHHQ